MIDNQDNFIVQRGDTLHKIEAENLMSTIQDSDLFLIQRDAFPFKVTAKTVKDDLGGGGGPGGGIYPSDNDITISPAVVGSGTLDDPFILTTRISAPAGSTVLSSETISFNGQPIETDVIWTDNSSPDSGTRFTQPVTLTDSNGDWSGQLQYADSPDSTGDINYIGDLQIGTLHFRWVVEQKLTDRIPTQVQSVNIVEITDGADRFTNQSFAFTSIIDDGAPLPTKTIEAYVSGTFDTEVTPKSSNTTSVGDGVDSGAAYEGGYTTDLNGGVTTGSWNNIFTNPTSDTSKFVKVTGTASNKPISQYDLPIYLNVNSSISFTVKSYDAGPSGNSTIELYSDVGAQVATLTFSGTNGVQTITDNLSSTIATIRLTSGTSSGGESWIYSVEVDGVPFGQPNSSLTGLTLTNNTVVEATTGEDTGLTVPEAFTPGLAVTSNGASGTVVSTADSEITVNPDTDPSWVVNPRNSGNTSTNSYQWAYGNGIYVKPSDTYPGLAWSTDGIAWTKVTASNVSNDFTTSISATSIAFGNGKFIAARSSNGGPYEYNKLFLTSTDGKNWTATPAPNDTRGAFYNIYYGGDNRWHVQSPYSTAYQVFSKSWYSSNGTSWTGVTVNPSQNVNDDEQLTNYLEIISTGNKFLLFGQSGPQMLYYGNGSSSWSRSSLNLSWPTNQKKAWAAGNGVFLMCYYNNTFARSTNGNSWTTIPGEWFPININYNEALDVWYAWQSNGDRIISRDNGQTFQMDAVYGSPGNEYDTRYEWSQREPENKRITFGINNNPNEPQFRYFVDAPVFKPGYPVEGATSNVETAKLYVKFNSDGVVTDLKGVPMDPPYTTTDTNPSLNLTFPSTFPSGETPDEELPEGTVLTVGIASENVVNRSPASGFDQATIQPALPESVSDWYATTLYSGNSVANTQIPTGIDNTSKSLVWIKVRTKNDNNMLSDSVRGEGPNGYYKLYTNNSSEQGGNSTALSSFDSNGFTTGAVDSESNASGQDYVAWNFKAAPKFFDVQTYAGEISGPEEVQTISHNLGAEPGVIIVKCVNDTGNWWVYHKDLGISVELELDSTGGANTLPNFWGDAPPTDTVFYAKNANINDHNRDFVAYLFADEPGLIKCGSYTGAGPGTSVDTGFKPQWVLIKCFDDADRNWIIADSSRPDEVLFPNKTDAAYPYTVTFQETGFTLVSNSSYLNTVDKNYIYVAIAAPVVETMTAAKFTETQLKFSTFENRSMVKCGNDAEAKRDNLILALEEQGYSLTEILKYL